MGGNSKNECHLVAELAEGVAASERDGGRVQIIVPGGKDVTEDNPEGLSHMQKAEALMASMWGVEVVTRLQGGEGLGEDDRLREDGGLGGADGACRSGAWAPGVGPGRKMSVGARERRARERNCACGASCVKRPALAVCAAGRVS